MNASKKVALKTNSGVPYLIWARRVSLFLLVLIVFAIPIEYKYDKVFRFFSLTLIPDGLKLPYFFDKRIYFYASDLAILILTACTFFIQRSRALFFSKGASYLWVILSLTLLSLILSPLAHYPLPYTRLLQLLTPFLLFSCLANGYHKEDAPKLTHLLFTTLCTAAFIQSVIAITQYFLQSPLGLRLLSEPTTFATLQTTNGERWIFDALFHRVASNPQLIRPSGTLSHANVLGGFLAISLLASYPFFFQSKWRRFAFVAFPVQFFAMSLTFSRAALFAWILGTTIWLWRSSLGQSMRQMTHSPPWRLIFFAIILSLSTSGLLLCKQISHRGGVFNYNQVAQSSDRERMRHHYGAIDLIRKHPLRGVGFQQISLTPVTLSPSTHNLQTDYIAPHNIYLYLATETGLICLAVFLIFFFSLFRAGIQTPATLQTSSLLAIIAAFLFIGFCDFYPLQFQAGKLLLFLNAGLLAAHCMGRTTSSSLQESWKMFNLISPNYDRINQVLSLGMDKNWRRLAASKLTAKTGIALLDVACGTGDQIISLFAAGVPIKTAIGIDLATEMLDIAKKKIDAKDYRKKVALMHADAEKLPFPDASFDAVTFSFGIRNVPDRDASLREIHRVLKPGGNCLILEFSLPPFPFKYPHLFYLRHILPKIGGLLSNNFAAYRYLNQTIETFPYGKAFCALLEKAKFTHIDTLTASLGAVTLYSGKKE
ncbi:MAG: bifunctional demethylmenaquinone methyltransferase/2-methoxy-6-polyprenyl-1,4-benzoquinol methylase UbiE [Chlamydiia bacterium]|nr:bifunctional demethylmenaquinone methyltransferase/2-methoxy-6-polyprenyl-1,4-benzoquinol methylase UbiE [Chlamydiia bacterium]